MYAANEIEVDRARQAKLARRPATQFGHHVVEPRGRLVAWHEAAAEHLVAALVRMVHRVVKDQHRSRLS